MVIVTKSNIEKYSEGFLLMCTKCTCRTQR